MQHFQPNFADMAPWTPKQHRFFEAVAHGMKPRGGHGPSVKDAKRMAKEGISTHARAVRAKIRGRG